MFKKTTEAQITRTIVREFLKEFDEYIESEVIVVGGGPSGLVAAYELAKNGVKTLIIESNNYLGGGGWLGGYLMNKLTIRKPGNFILDELRISYRETKEGLIVADGPLVTAKLIAAALEAGAKVVNMTRCKDVVLRKNKVEGVVINWTPVDALPRAITCVDPVCLEAKVVIDATGHDAWVSKYLADRKLIEMKGMGPMDVELSEETVVTHTREVYPGLIVAGMAVSTVFGLPRMGPTFGAMYLSGKKAAEIALLKLGKKTIDERLKSLVKEKTLSRRV